MKITLLQRSIIYVANCVIENIKSLTILKDSKSPELVTNLRIVVKSI